jgi:hypothetical protein
MICRLDQEICCLEGSFILGEKIQSCHQTPQNKRRTHFPPHDCFGDDSSPNRISFVDCDNELGNMYRH